MPKCEFRPNVAHVFGRDFSASLSELGGTQPPCKVVSDLTLDKLILTEARPGKV